MGDDGVVAYDDADDEVYYGVPEIPDGMVCLVIPKVFIFDLHLKKNTITISSFAGLLSDI